MASLKKIETAEASVPGVEGVIQEGSIMEYELSQEEDKRLLRKIDKYLLAGMAISYFFQFLDKTALGNTAIMGLNEDLRLTGSDYSWASGIYYFGYLAASYPAGVMMVRWKVGKLISVSILIWGAIVMLTATCTDAGSLLAARFFLGVAEAPIAPGLTVIVSMWYKRSEQPLRHTAWFLGNTFAGIFGGLIQYGIGHIQTIEPWKAVFLILGAATVCWSAFNFFLLPDTPSSAWFLNKSDHDKAMIRVKENMTGIKSNQFKWSQCFEAISDIKTWFLILIQLTTTIPNGAVTSFNSIIIKSFGFDTFHTLLLSCVPYGLQLFLVLIATGASAYFHNARTLWMAWHFLIALVGAAVVRQLPQEDKWGRFTGTILSLGYSANFPLYMSLMSGNFGGFTKKTTVNAMVFIAYCAGNIIGPQLFFEREAPAYNSGFLAIMICFGLGAVLSLALRFYLIRVNSARDRVTNDTSTACEMEQNGMMVNLMDKTDKEILQFRYVY